MHNETIAETHQQHKRKTPRKIAEVKKNNPSPSTQTSMMIYGYEMQAMSSKNTTRIKHANTKEDATDWDSHEPNGFDLPSKPKI